MRNKPNIILFFEKIKERRMSVTSVTSVTSFFTGLTS